MTRASAQFIASTLNGLPAPLRSLPHVRLAAAANHFVGRGALTHDRPSFRVATRERVVRTNPFCSLLHFEVAHGAKAPKVLLIAPLSGHFSTLLQPTIDTLLADHDVYLTDWHNARDVSVRHGRFDLDDYVTEIMGCIETAGRGVHVIAVCQPVVAALAATALLAQQKSPFVPSSLTLMAGPIDARVNPTAVNELAVGNPLSWFESNFITSVPDRYSGAGRRVYPGFLQISAFATMNADRHLHRHIEWFGSLVRGEPADKVADFYDEYFAVADLPAEFYLDTVSRVFQSFDLARGQLHVRGQRVDPAAITRTAISTIEAGRDDICGVGQTAVAHDLCTRVPASKRHAHVEADVGHYGVFSGTRWTANIYPQVKAFIEANDRRRA